jgi:hypothetical protein
LNGLKFATAPVISYFDASAATLVAPASKAVDLISAILGGAIGAGFFGPAALVPPPITVNSKSSSSA